MSSEPAVRPRSVAELADVLREGAATGAPVDIAGAGSKAGWGGLGRPDALVVGTTELAGLVEHAPGDLVVSVLAGTPLVALQEELGAHKQWLALDPPESGATIGGILATAASGPHRLRFGTPRDQLIGITVVLADGTVAKAGGKVVKNVAGYDLGKLFTGSYGTLGVIATATFKLQPQPPARRVVSAAAPLPGETAAAIAASTAAPAAAEWDGSRVHVVVEGSAAAVDSVTRDLSARLGDADVGDRLPVSFGARPWAPGEVAMKLTHRLSALDDIITAVRRCLPGARLSAHVGSGVVWCGWPATSPGDVGPALDELRATVATSDGTAVVVDAPDEVKRVVDVWGPVRGAALMQRIKERFDPDRRLNAGRFVDGI